jgi:hypothetical protein
MSKEKYCYIHKNTPTRLSCSSCGKPICTKCVRPAAIGYICPDCNAETKSDKTKESLLSLFHTIFQALLAGIVLGFLFNFVKKFGMFISWGCAYLVGFGISKTITKNSGFQNRKRFIAIVTAITLISLVYNPISLFITGVDLGLPSALMLFTIYYISNIMNLISIVIAVWAAIRHLKF